MPELFFQCILAMLSVIGLLHLYRLLSDWLLHSKSVCVEYTILQFDKNNEDAEYILREHIAKIQCRKNAAYSRILCIEESMNGAMQQVCRTLAREYPFIIVCSVHEIHDYITNMRF